MTADQIDQRMRVYRPGGGYWRAWCPKCGRLTGYSATASEARDVAAEHVNETHRGTA